MAVVIGDAAVRLRANSEGFSEEAQAGIAGPMGAVAKKAAGIFAAAFAAQKVGEFLKDSVAQYSDLSESVSKSGVVFGAYSKQVSAFAANAASSMGISQQEATESAATFGNLAVSLGLSQKQSANMSTSLVKLGGDLASFNNVDPAQAIEALRSGLVGETEPLRQFGINLNQAALKQQALKMGLDASGPTLSAAVQAQAAYALIMQQSTTAQGDFIRTSGGLANQQRIIAAQFTDLKANVGGALYPIVQLGAHALSGVLLPALLHMTSGFAAFGTGIGTVLNATQQLAGGADPLTVFNGLGPVQARLASVGTAIFAVKGDWWSFVDAVKGGGLGIAEGMTGPMGAILRFGDGLHGVAQDAKTEWMTVRTSAIEAIAPLGGQLAGPIASVKASIGSMFSGLFDSPGLKGAGAGFLGFLHSILGSAGPAISGMLGTLGAQIGPFVRTIADLFQQAVPIVQQVFAQIVPVIRAVVPVIEQISGIWRTLFLTAVKALLPVIPPIVTTVGQLISTLVSGLAPILTSLAPLISTLVNQGVKEFSAVLKALVPVIPPLVSALAEVAQTIAGALLSVLQALMPVLPPLIGAIAQIATAIGGALVQAVGAIAPLLPTLINAFMSLVQAALLPLMPLLPAIASLIPPIAGVIAALVSALAPFLPLIIRVVVTLVQLAVTALQPLMPIIQIVASLLVVLVNAAVPLISLGMRILSVWLSLAGGMISGVVGAVSGVISWFQRLLASISGIVAAIGRWLGGMFDGLAGAARGAFEAVVGVVKGAINGIIGIINGAIGFINRDLIDVANKVPFVNIPHIPTIPKLHEGGEFLSGKPDGEGLALLRDHEIIVTPEQRHDAAYLSGLFDGPPPPAAGAMAVRQASPTVNNYITQLPGESGATLAARVSDRVVFNLNNGVTHTVGAGVPS